VGERDGGVLLSDGEYAALRARAAVAARHRIYVAWRNTAGQDCWLIGPDTKCASALYHTTLSHSSFRLLLSLIQVTRN